MSQSEEIISLAWRLYSEKVASTMLNPRNEKMMMQLQFAQILQLLAPLYEARSNESYKVHLELISWRVNTTPQNEWLHTTPLNTHLTALYRPKSHHY